MGVYVSSDSPDTAHYPLSPFHHQFEREVEVYSVTLVPIIVRKARGSTFRRFHVRRAG
jgi:hypothetical protein